MDLATTMLRAWLKRGGTSLWRLAHDHGGGIAVTTALMATTLFGFAGLAVDGSYWYYTRRAMQTAADAGAIAGARDLYAGASSSTATSSANNDAALNGFSASTGATVNVTVSSNPQSVTVSITKPAQLFFAGIFFSTPPTIAATATAGLVNNGTPACLLTLAQTASNVDNLNGNPTITAPNCAMVNDSTSSSALVANGNVTVNDGQTCGPGGYLSAGHVTFNPPPSKCAALQDPFANTTLPPEVNAPCDPPNNNLQVNSGSRTLSAGVYCGGITINTNGNVTFSPSSTSNIFVIRNGPLIINGDANIFGSGVTFYLSGSNTGIIFNGNGTISLSAPPLTSSIDPTTAGFLVFQDPSTAVDSVNNIINGNSNVDYQGILYFGKQNLTLNGDGNINGMSSNTMVIADKMTFNGNGTWNFPVNNQSVPAGLRLQNVALIQ